jgi:methanogenic corrinoid protein MtbC1
MYTIKQAARLTGVPEASLRAWERRYGVVTPHRNDAGYRIYDEDAVATLAAMRRLVDARWSPAEAARAVLRGDAPTATDPVREAPTDPVPEAPTGPAPRPGEGQPPPAVTYLERFLDAAAALDTGRIEDCLDHGFALGSFEHVVDSWLFPTLEALGEGWARGEIDVAGEHAASHAVHRRLAAAFNAAGNRSTGPSVVVGLPPGSHHELGVLAFATALRRNGIDVLYLGADVPETSWELAVRTRAARAAVIAVVTDRDRAAAVAVAERLLAHDPGLLVASGGASGAELTPAVWSLGPAIGTAAEQLDHLLGQRAG